MYHFHGIDFGPTSVDIKADGLREAMDKMGHLYSLHKDALFLEAHERRCYDLARQVVPMHRVDTEGYVYRGLQCLRTGCNITFKEKNEHDGIFPGRFRAYINGDDRPRLYDPRYDPEEILSKVGPETSYVREFGVDIGENGIEGNSAPPTHAPPERGQHVPSSGPENVTFDDLSPKQKVKRVEGKLKSLSLSERPDFIARLASWKGNLPKKVREMVDDLITEYATEDAYDARMVEIDNELHSASEEGGDTLREACFSAAQEASVWPPNYREPARAVIASHAPDDIDVEERIYQNADPAPAQ